MFNSFCSLLELLGHPYVASRVVVWQELQAEANRLNGGKVDENCSRRFSQLMETWQRQRDYLPRYF